MPRLTTRVLAVVAALSAIAFYLGGASEADADTVISTPLRTKLVADGGFENAGCWSLGGAGAPTATMASAIGRTGKRAGSVVGRGPVTSTIELTSGQDKACRTAIGPGRLLAVGVWYQSSAPVRLVANALLSTGAWTRFAVSAPFSGSTPWSSAEFITPATPAKTVAVSIGLATSGDVRLVVDDATLYDAGVPTAQAGRALFTAVLPNSGLVANEYAYYNPDRADAVKSPAWVMTSGSLFGSSGMGWTGAIDGKRPDAASSKATDSAVFRLRTATQTYGDVSVGFQVKIGKLTSTTRTPVTAWDGVHIWLRYQDAHHLYAASVARRNGAIVLKKKCPGAGGDDDDYYSLSKEIPGYPIKIGVWRPVAASARTNPDGSVTLTLSVGGVAVISATDAGTGCAPITGTGAIGLRGDNSEFLFSGLTVTGQ